MNVRKVFLLTCLIVTANAGPQIYLGERPTVVLEAKEFKERIESAKDANLVNTLSVFQVDSFQLPKIVKYGKTEEEHTKNKTQLDSVKLERLKNLDPDGTKTYDLIVSLYEKPSSNIEHIFKGLSYQAKDSPELQNQFVQFLNSIDLKGNLSVHEKNYLTQSTRVLKEWGESSKEIDTFLLKTIESKNVIFITAVKCLGKIGSEGSLPGVSGIREKLRNEGIILDQAISEIKKKSAKLPTSQK